MTETNDAWTAGDAYERFMGRWSRRLAERFVAWLAVPSEAHWLDVGCGTGALTEAIERGAKSASVVGCDLSAPLVECARKRPVGARVSFEVAGVGRLPSRSGGYQSVTSLFALNFFPDLDAALAEMAGLTTPNGVLSACVWDYAGGMEFLRRFWDAAIAEDAGARELDEGRRFPLCRPEALATAFQRQGLAEVVCEAIEIPTLFSNFADYWSPFLGGTGPAPSYVTKLDLARRESLAARLESTLPRAADGSIPLVARAWAVRGFVRG